MINDKPVSEQIDEIIEAYGGWRAATLTKLRRVILAADPEIYEEVKWKMPTRPLGLPVWSCHGIVCMAEIFKDNIKLVFPKGAALPQGEDLFNARLRSETKRAIEFLEGSRVDESALHQLVASAAKLNQSVVT